MMSKKLFYSQLKSPDFIIKKSKYIPSKRSNFIQFQHSNKYNLNRSCNRKYTQAKLTMDFSSPKRNYKDLETPTRKGKVHLTILSPNSKTRISYLNKFNNNVVYYSNHKNTNHKSQYENQYLSTEERLTYQKNKYNLSLKKPTGFEANNKLFVYEKKLKMNLNESSKSNFNEGHKRNNYFPICNLSSRNNDLKREFNTCIKKPQISSKKFDSLPKRKNLSDYCSPKKLFSENKSENEKVSIINTFRANKINNEFKKILKTINIFPVNINPEEYEKISQIGSGTFGKIFKVKWIKNKKNYAMKEMSFFTEDNIFYLKERVKFILEFNKKCNCNGLIKIFGDCSFKKGTKYYYYEIMELADRDWEQEIKIRKENSNFYTENELFSIMKQLIKTLSLLQQHHITHRDIKLQNILLVNNKFKICDFGESRTLNQKGIIAQPIRGSELYMSPILFFGLNQKLQQVIHNTYKSDIFSLGMCMLFASNLNDNILYDIREVTDMDKIRNILKSYLNKRYSDKYIEFLLCMLEINEKKRPDFIQFEKVMKQCGIMN